MTDLIDQIREIIAKETDAPMDRITPEAKLSDLGADSLDVIEIIMGRALRERSGYRRCRGRDHDGQVVRLALHHHRASARA